jgi:hypothetical protein
MIENLMVSLGLMFISGITFIAYKHPDLYNDKLSGRLNNACLVFLLGAISYNATINITFNTLKEFIIPESLDKASLAKESLRIPLYIFALPVALWAYSFFLTWLSYHMKHYSSHDKI